MAKAPLNILLLVVFLSALAGCETAQPGGINPGQPPRPDEFIGRRVYKKDCKFWGYVRQPGQKWNTAKLVMLNEKLKLAPDREAGNIGSDNNYEYKLFGHFSGATVYDPASNGFHPEFVLTGYELISVDSPPVVMPRADTDYHAHLAQ